jgi:predicted permease
MIRIVLQRARLLATHALGVFRSRRIESDVQAEMDAHIQMRTDLLIAQGMSPDRAPLEARRRFGNRTLLQESARGQELLPRLESIVQDLQYGLRLLRRNLGFTSIAVLTLGLGIGLNAAMFSIFHHTLLAPLEFAEPDRLYVISSHAASAGDVRRASSGPDFRDYRDQATVFSGVAAAIPRFSEVWTGDGEPRVVNCAAPTQQFFAVLGIRPALGRVFVPDEFHDLHNETLIVSWKFWKNQLGGDPHVIGRTLRLEDVPSVIVGVLPPMTDLYSDVDVWLKLTTEPAWPYMNWRANKFLDVIGRLKQGVNPQVAEQQLTSILRRGVGEPSDVKVQLTPLREFAVGPVSRQVAILMAAVAVVLLVTLLNTAAVLLARSINRSPELAMRLGLGASRARIRRQLLVEGLLLSTAGGALGVALAGFAIGFVRRLAEATLPRIDGLRLDGAAIGVSFLVVALSGIVFALLPGTLLKLDLASAFRGGRTETGRAQRPFAALVVGEIACAVVLAVCAGLLVRSFMRVHAVDLGYQPDRVVSAYLRNNYADPQGLPFWRNVLEVTRSLPGSTSAAISDCVPSSRANAATILFEDRRNLRGREPSTEACWISADYFRTLGATVLQGRFFSEHDEPSSPAVMIINAEAARRLFPDEDPIGKRVAVNYLALGSRAKDSIPRMREIVGVVSNLRQRGADLPVGPAVYLPYTQDETYHVLNSMNVYVRSASNNPAALGPSIRAAVQAMYPNQPVERIQVMRQVIARSIARRTYAVVLMAGFASLALLLCGLGTFGVVSYVMQQRTREFGIRMALGAQRGNILRDVLQHGGTLIAIGILLGIAVSLVATRALAQLLFETPTVDLSVYAVAILVLSITGLGACLLPALRASRLDARLALNEQ